MFQCIILADPVILVKLEGTAYASTVAFVCLDTKLSRTLIAGVAMRYQHKRNQVLGFLDIEL